MERLLSILALVAAIGAGVYAYVSSDRQRADMEALNQKVESLTKTVSENQKALGTLTEELGPILQMIREQMPQEPAMQLDMTKLSDEANAAFLKEFGDQDGVMKLPSGAMYKVEKPAPAGAKQASKTSVVTVNYAGSFIDGTIFDSSYDRGQPAQFALEGLIPGWLEIIPLMKEGDVWQVVLPYQLGYGTEGKGPIPGKQTLIFKIELLKVNS